MDAEVRLQPRPSRAWSTPSIVSGDRRLGATVGVIETRYLQGASRSSVAFRKGEKSLPGEVDV